MIKRVLMLVNIITNDKYLNDTIRVEQRYDDRHYTVRIDDADESCTINIAIAEDYSIAICEVLCDNNMYDDSYFVFNADNTYTIAYK
jgi:hypothetical protein